MSTPYDNEIGRLREENYKYRKKFEQILSFVRDYEESCKMNCIDDRMCHSCFFGSAKELGDEIKDIIYEI